MFLTPMAGTRAMPVGSRMGKKKNNARRWLASMHVRTYKISPRVVFIQFRQGGGGGASFGNAGGGCTKKNDFDFRVRKVAKFCC